MARLTQSTVETLQEVTVEKIVVVSHPLKHHCDVGFRIREEAHQRDGSLVAHGARVVCPPAAATAIALRDARVRF